MLNKLKEKLKGKFVELKKDIEEQKELKQIEKEAYFKAKKEAAEEFAKKKVVEEQKVELKAIKEKPKKKSNWDFWGGIERMNKEMAGSNKNKPEKDINEKLKEIL